MSPILYAIPFFLALIAIELVVAQKMGKSVYRFHDTITSLNIGFISETIRSIAKLMSIAVYALVVDQVASFTWDVKGPAVWIVSFFMYDFFYYWAHRSGHEVNLLWASHVVHHDLSHPLQSSRPPRAQRLLHRHELRRHPHCLGPSVWYLCRGK